MFSFPGLEETLQELEETVQERGCIQKNYRCKVSALHATVVQPIRTEATLGRQPCVMQKIFEFFQ